MDCDVLICGFGPVGQLLALLLGKTGVNAIAVDEASEPYDLPRAAVIDDEVMRIFQSVGVDESVLSETQVQKAVSFVTDGGHKMQVFRTESGENGHPPLVAIHQPSMERTLVAAVAERDEVEVRWNTRVEALDRAAEHVDVWTRPTAGGPLSRIRARYVVACDGGKSFVRRTLGIAFGGSTFSQRWLVLDALVDRPIAKVPHPTFIGDVSRPTVSMPLAPGRHRWEFMIHPDEDAEPFEQPERINELLAPWIGDEQIEFERTVVYTFHVRRAERWRAGRILLAGDSAHLTPPFVGQGFSSGARDAQNAAWKLDAVLHGAPSRLLDTYEAERRPHVKAMQDFAVRWGGVVQTVDPRIGRLRDATLRTAKRTGFVDWVQERAKPLPTYGGGAFARRPARLPFRRDVGSLFHQPDHLDDLLGPGWAAVALTDPAAVQWRTAGVHSIVRPEDTWLAGHGCEWALLRPDRFVFACGGDREFPNALHELRSQIGTGVRSGAPEDFVEQPLSIQGN